MNEKQEENKPQNHHIEEKYRENIKDNKGKIGRTGVTVPGFFYKVVYAPGARQMIAFVLPNTQEKRQLRDYAVTVDSVERLTNIDFFPQLSDTLENRLEAAVYYDSWR